MPKTYQYDPNGSEYDKYDFSINNNSAVSKSDYLIDGYEAKALFDRMAAGDKDATNEFYDRFALYVKTTIEKFWPSYTEEHMADIFNEAWMEIMASYKKYNPEKGPVHLYFLGYIKNAFKLYSSRFLLELTPERTKQVLQLKKIIDNIQASENRIPDDIELSVLTGWKPSIVKNVRKDIYAAFRHLYKDNSRFEENADEDIGIIGEADDPETSILKKETLEYLRQAVEALPYTQREVLKRKWGIFGYDKQLEAQIASDIGISAYEIPRLEYLAQKAILANKKIRNYYYNRELDIQTDLGDEPITVIPEKAAESLMNDIEIYLIDEDADSIIDEPTEITFESIKKD